MELSNINTEPQVYSQRADGVNYSNFSDDSLDMPGLSETAVESMGEDLDYSHHGEYLDVEA